MAEVWSSSDSPMARPEFHPDLHHRLSRWRRHPRPRR